MSKAAGVVAVIGLIIFAVASAAFGAPSLSHYALMSRGFQAVGALLFLGSIVVAMLTYREPRQKSSGP